MARAYTVATVALALEVAPKWLDNLLSHHRVPGVERERQGKERRLTVPAIMALAVVITLVTDLSLGVAPSISLATKLVAAEGRLRTTTGLTIELDMQALSKSVIQRLNDAVEIAPVPRRGRPPQNKTGRLA